MSRPAFRMLAGGIDQILSSVSNALVVFAVARSSGVADFGHAALMFSIVAAAIGIARGAVGTPLLLLGGADAALVRRETRSAAAAAALFGVGVGVLVAVASVLVHAGGLGIAFAVVTPFALTQDALRFAAVTAGKPQFALWSDALWTTGSVALLGVTWFAPTKLSAAALLWGWGLAAALALLLLCVLLRLTPNWHGLPEWWRPDNRDRLRFALDSGLEQTTVIAVVTISTGVAGPVAAAALRGGVTVLGPFAILLNALTLVAIPEASRANYSLRRLWRRLRALALPTSLAALAIGCGTHLLPDRIGRLALGDTWAHSAGVLPVLGLEYAALCWVSAAYNLFRYRRDTRLLVAIRVGQALLTTTVCACLGAVFPTPAGIASALAVTACITALVLVTTARDQTASEPAPQRTPAAR